MSKDAAPIIIKRVTKKHDSHGGGWKIAYADFMTAMMAFFMLMWLLSMLNKSQLQGISNYFKKPMKSLFIENQRHNTNIPKAPTEHTEKSELAPIKNKKDGHSIHFDPRIQTNKSEPDVAKTDTEGKQSDKLASLAKKAQLKLLKAQELEELHALKAQLEHSLQTSPEVRKYIEHLDFKVVADGLKINISSLKNKPMFSTGKTDFSKYVENIIHWLSQELNKTPRKMTIIGHTDTEPYHFSSVYGNWELSADRANAVRRYLIQYGVPADKFIRVQGSGSTNLLFKKEGSNPANRRIELIVLTEEATKRMTE